MRFTTGLAAFWAVLAVFALALSALDAQATLMAERAAVRQEVTLIITEPAVIDPLGAPVGSHSEIGQ